MERAPRAAEAETEAETEGEAENMRLWQRVVT